MNMLHYKTGNMEATGPLFQPFQELGRRGDRTGNIVHILTGAGLLLALIPGVGARKAGMPGSWAPSDPKICGRGCWRGYGRTPSVFACPGQTAGIILTKDP